MSLALQEKKHTKKTNPLLVIGVVKRVKADSNGLACYDVIDDEGGIYISCYPLAINGAEAVAPYKEDDEVVILKKGLDGLNFIIGGTTRTLSGDFAYNFTNLLEGDDIPGETEIISENYNGTSPGDFNVQIDTTTRFNLNQNLGATIEAPNVGIQIQGGILRISNLGDADEYVINGEKFAQTITAELHEPLLEYIRLASQVEQQLRNQVSQLATAITTACELEIASAGPGSTLATQIITALSAIQPPYTASQWATNLGNNSGLEAQANQIMGTSGEFQEQIENTINRSIKIPATPDETQRNLTDF